MFAILFVLSIKSSFAKTGDEVFELPLFCEFSSDVPFFGEVVLKTAIVASVSPSCAKTAASSASSSSSKIDDKIFAIELTEYV